ncbi:MAG: hypothetical protein JKY31_02745 [Rhodobacteraceae bacterium]|nr:hypothetical protein [Paracoccaceae bacterium]
MKLVSLVALGFLVSGCLPQGRFEITHSGDASSFQVPNVISGNCGASGFQGLLTQNQSALAGVTLPEGTRVIHPGTVFTRDAVSSRLNIGISSSGTIVHVACG